MRSVYAFNFDEVDEVTPLKLSGEPRHVLATDVNDAIAKAKEWLAYDHDYEGAAEFAVTGVWLVANIDWPLDEPA